MGMSNHSDVPFRGLVYLVDEATSAKPVKVKQASTNA
jgi:hypothetical protein